MKISGLVKSIRSNCEFHNYWLGMGVNPNIAYRILHAKGRGRYA